MKKRKDKYDIVDIEAALKERVKELECLYEISHLAFEKQEKELEEILNDILKILPKAWQFPHITHARINFDDIDYKTHNYKKGQHKLTSDIIINGQTRGFVEIVYAQKKTLLHEYPFLKEERSLIETIAKELSQIIHRNEQKKEKEILKNQLRHADRLATVGELAAGVAHELNEPLGSILGFAQLIKNDKNISEQIENDIDKIITGSLHAREIIKKLLSFSKYEEKENIKISLNQIIKDSLYILKSRSKKENINIVLILEDELPSFFVNPVQINQVLINLCVNSFQAIPNGGEIVIQTFSANENIYLVIQDTGVGISEQVMKRIFDPFFSTKDTGTGLGLTLVNSIVASYGGSIKTESNVGNGTRFEISFPIKIKKENNRNLL
jgi:signal transduction histidine kinase